MSALIVLACIVPPLAVMVIAAVHGFRTANAGILSILALSFGILAGSMLLADGSDEPSGTLRFDVANRAEAQQQAALRAHAPERGL